MGAIFFGHPELPTHVLFIVALFIVIWYWELAFVWWIVSITRGVLIFTLMKCFALLSSPRVVWRELSAPTGTKSLRFSRQLLKCALRFFSNSLWVDLKINFLFNSLILSKRMLWLECQIKERNEREREACCELVTSLAADADEYIYESQVFRLYQQLGRWTQVFYGAKCLFWSKFSQFPCCLYLPHPPPTPPHSAGLPPLTQPELLIK